MPDFTIKVTELSYHRNGICGNGFYAILFDAVVDGDKHNTHWLATVFDEPGSVAVINLDMIPTDGVRFARNSWRGDNFEPQLRDAIRAADTNRF